MVENTKKSDASVDLNKIKRLAHQSFGQFLMTRMIRVENAGKRESYFYPEAIQLYSEAIELDSQNAIYYSNRAFVYIQSEKYDQALKDCDAAIAIDNSFT